MSHLKVYDKNIIKDYSYVNLALRSFFPAIVFSFQSTLSIFTIIHQNWESATM